MPSHSVRSVTQAKINPGVPVDIKMDATYRDPDGSVPWHTAKPR